MENQKESLKKILLLNVNTLEDLIKYLNEEANLHIRDINDLCKKT